MEVDEPAEEEPIPPVVPTPSVPALPSVSSNVKIRKDYNPKGKKEVFRCLNFLEFEYIASFFIVFKGFPLTVAPLAWLIESSNCKELGFKSQVIEKMCSF